MYNVGVRVSFDPALQHSDQVRNFQLDTNNKQEAISGAEKMALWEVGVVESEAFVWEIEFSQTREL